MALCRLILGGNLLVRRKDPFSFRICRQFAFPLSSAEGDGEDCPSSKLDYLGCHGNATLDRFTRALPDSANNSVLGCTGRCRLAGYTYAALVNGTGCRCGRLQPITRLRREASECDAPCPGEPERECGGRGRVDRANVYYVEPDGESWGTLNSPTSL